MEGMAKISCDRLLDQMRSRHASVADSLSRLRNQEGDYANEHRKLLTIYGDVIRLLSDASDKLLTEQVADA